MSDEYFWHDGKTDPPPKAGKYLTCVYWEPPTDMVNYCILYYCTNARVLDYYRYSRDKPKKGTCIWYDIDSEYGDVIYDAPDYWMPLPEYPKREKEVRNEAD